MKQPVEKRRPSGVVDYIALAFTTFGVGYIPGAPGTYGSAVGVLIWIASLSLIETAALSIFGFETRPTTLFWACSTIFAVIGLTTFSLVGIWASGRSIPLLGNEDPSQAVVDEVMGQIITFLFVPFIFTWNTQLMESWKLLLGGFLLFRLFDIWKPFPIRDLEILPGGLGICADDIVAGVYAGICLAVGYAIYIAI